MLKPIKSAKTAKKYLNRKKSAKTAKKVLKSGWGGVGEGGPMTGLKLIMGPEGQ